MQRPRQPLAVRCGSQQDDNTHPSPAILFRSFVFLSEFHPDMTATEMLSARRGLHTFPERATVEVVCGQRDGVPNDSKEKKCTGGTFL